MYQPGTREIALARACVESSACGVLPGMRAAACVTLILGLAACGPEPGTNDSTSGTGDTSTGTGTTPTSGSDETADTTGETVCFAVDYPSKRGPPNDPGWELGCGFPALCPGELPVVFSIAGDLDAPTSVETGELERARCMARALRDRQFGQFAFMPVDADGWVVGLYSLEIVGEQALARGEPGQCQLENPCKTHEALRLLRPPEFFAACVDGDARALFLCLWDPIVPEPACLAGPLPCR